MKDDTGAAKAGKTEGRRPRRGLGLSASILALALAAGTTLIAQADMPGPGMHHGMPGGMGFEMMGGPHMAQHIDRMLDGLNATDAQRNEIKQIAEAAATDLRGQHQSELALHQRNVQIFGAPTVDAVAAESVRQQMQTQHDASSRRMLQAMLDVSRVLTPEQRALLARRASDRAARMQEHMQRPQAAP